MHTRHARTMHTYIHHMTLHDMTSHYMTAHSITGLSKTINISLGIDFVAGKNLVPKPAIGKIAFFMDDISGEVDKKIKKTQPKRISLAMLNFLVIQSDPPRSG